jgi:hypothetical protein
MPELQMPNIAGNFLSSYYTAQQKQQADADRQRNMQRQDTADQYAADDREQAKAARNLDIVARAALSLDTPEKWAAQAPAVMASIGATGPVPGFDQRDRIIAEAQSVTEQLKAKMDERKFRLDERQTNASIRASDAAANRSNAAARQYSTQGGAGASDVYDSSDPFAGLSDKARERLILQNAKEYSNVAKENDKEAQGARATITDANRFAQLSDQVNAPGDWSTGTGGLAGFPIIRQAQAALDSRFSEMESVTARLVPKLREPGSGATSDFDASMFQRGTVGVEKPGPTNKAISVGMRAAAQNLIDKAGFEEAYFKARKTLVGAQDAWQQYLEANPIFDPSSQNEPKLNQRRVNWKRYFGAEGVAARPQAAAPAAEDFSDVDALLGLK